MLNINLNKKIIFIIGIIIIVLIFVITYVINSNNNDNIEEFNEIFEITKSENILKNEEIINSEDINEQLLIIHIAGEVKNPGIVKLNKNSRIIDAIEKAGGLTKNANLDRINLAYVLSDGEKIYIPNLEEKEEKDIIIKDSGFNEKNSNQTLSININTANLEEFQKLPGVGKAMAQRIIEYRNKNGKFIKIEDIKNVSGIGETKFNNIKKYLKIN